MLARIAAITLILVCTSVAWFILGSTIDDRTNHADGQSRPGVASIWGSPQEQCPPTATYTVTDEQRIETETDGHKTIRTETHSRPLPAPLEASRIDVAVALEHRQRGLLWYSTYVVDFSGVYTFRNPTSDAHLMTYRLTYPAEQAIYDGLVVELDGRELPAAPDKHGISVTAPLAAQGAATFRVAYRSQGLDSWRYRIGGEVGQARDFALTLKTNFKEIDFPLNALSPTKKTPKAGGWELAWRYTNLISGFQIGITCPKKLQPGPLAGQISYFAPVSLLLFFFVMFLITTLRGIDLHPMNYFFLAAAFFSFHLLLAYLVDHISIQLAFLICSAVSVSLTVSYLRLVTGRRFALVEAGGAQFIYLVLFSYAFFLPGFTGLTVTLGCIVTLGLAMQLTGRVRWAERFARPSRAHS